MIEYEIRYCEYRHGFIEARTKAIFEIGSFIDKCHTDNERKLVAEISHSILNIWPTTTLEDYHKAQEIEGLRK